MNIYGCEVPTALMSSNIHTHANIFRFNKVDFSRLSQCFTSRKKKRRNTNKPQSITTIMSMNEWMQICYTQLPFAKQFNRNIKTTWIAFIAVDYCLVAIEWDIERCFACHSNHYAHKWYKLEENDWHFWCTISLFPPLENVNLRKKKKINNLYITNRIKAQKWMKNA